MVILKVMDLELAKKLAEERGYYKIEKQLPATSRQDIIAKLRALGGR